MICITNGRVLYGDYSSQINCFLMVGGEEIPIYKLKDNSRYFDIKDKVSTPAISDKDFKEGGAWTDYFIEFDKPLMFKFHIATRSPDLDEKGQFYFAASDRYLNCYTTNILHREGNIYKNEIQNVINGSCIYLPKKYMESRGVNNNLHQDYLYKEIINCTKFKEKT